MHADRAIFYGWVVALSAFVVLFITYGVQYSFGVFVPRMLRDLNWPHTTLGGAFSLYSMVYAAFSFVSGRLTDTLGPRRVVGTGAVMLGAGIMLTSQISSPWQLYLSYGLVAAIGMSTAYIPCNMTVVRWFDRKRGLALGFASSGSSFGLIVVPLIASVLIAQTDWRTAFLWLGMAVLALAASSALFMVRSPELMGLVPDGTDNPVHRATEAAVSADWSFGEARRTWPFWHFLLALTVTLITVPVPFVHIVAFATDLGLSGQQGAWAVSIIGLFAFIGGMTLGPLSDRIGRKNAFTVGLMAQVAAYLLFLTAESSNGLYLGAGAFGFFYGSVASLFPALVGDLFGRAHAGAIAGFLFGCAGILGAWGPAVAGYLRDIGEDYRTAFLWATLSAMASLILFFTISRPLPRTYCRP